MLENIKRIGLFMIVAQTFTHFAAGKQYEKYMKIISGVIVLLLFAGPFTSTQGNLVEQWQEQVERMMEQIENSDVMRSELLSDTDYGASDQVIQQLEKEMKDKLNDSIKDEEYIITDVLIEWESSGSEQSGERQKTAVKGITITLQKANQSGESPAKEAVFSPIIIEKIQIGDDTENEQESRPEENLIEEDTEQKRKIEEFRDFLAEILGIDADKVEVVYVG